MRILPCNCSGTTSGNTAGATFQNERYASGKRVHNQCKIKGGGPGWRCTVCSTVKEGVK